MSIDPQRLALAERIARRLSGAGSIAVATHVGGDGDGWGSACAIAHHFGPRGVDVRLLAGTPVPERLRFLLPDGVTALGPDRAGFAGLESADVQVVVDASELSRLGPFAAHFKPERTIVIDHHGVAMDRIEAALSLIDPAAAATAELIYDVLTQTGDAISPVTATALYVGLVTDTGSFRYSNSTPHSHRLAARLIEAGADPEKLYRPLFATLTPSELDTLRAALESLQVDQELGLVWSALDLETCRRCGPLDEYEGVIDHLRNLEGVEIAVLFREREPGAVKISLRSTGAADVAAVARSFGGGGHEKAAGATVEGELDAVETRVLRACREALRPAAGSQP